MTCSAPNPGVIVKSDVPVARNPLFCSSRTASRRSEFVAVVAGGAVGGVVAAGAVDVVVCAAVVVVPAGAVVDDDVDDVTSPGTEVVDDETVVPLVVVSAFEDPPELHAAISKTATASPMIGTRVRLDAKAFIRAGL